LKRRPLLERITDNWPAKIISLAAAALLFLFYRINTMEERFFSVPLRVSPPAGLAIAKPYPKSARVTLRGKAEAIFSVLEDDIEVYADFGRFNTEGQMRVPVRVKRTGSSLNIEPLDIRVEPAEISITLERHQVKTVPVRPVLTGTPPPGYDLVQSSVTPPALEISGARSVVNATDHLSTQEIDLSGRSADFTIEVPILRDSPLLTYPRDATVVFRGIVREAVVIRTFDNVDIISVDLSPQLRLAAPLPKGSVRVQGTQAAIEALGAGQLRLVVDCSGVSKAGRVLLRPQPDIPPDIVVLKFEPQELELTILPARGEVDSG
jgi:YbbR domain-containing protein